MCSQQLGVEFDEKKIDAIFAELNQCQLPGGAVGIAINGRPVYRKGFGLASMELPLVLSPTIRMRIGSTTKQFTAFAYMLLCEKGRASVDDPVGKFLPEFHPVARQVTMRQLMANTSGLRDVYDVELQFSGSQRISTSAEILALYRDIDDVNAAPGVTWNYNNGGWEILAAVIERITGQPFEDALRELIFEPLGMYDTRLRRSDTDFVSNSATPHALSSNSSFRKSYWSEFTGSGGMVSTVDDLLRWLIHMDSPRIGTDATWAAMKTPQVLPNGTSTGYGFGLIIGRYRGIQTLEHSGNWVGGNAQMLKVPGLGLDIVVAVNRNDVLGLQYASKILDTCLPNLDSTKKAVTKSFATGTFHSPTTGRVIQLFRGDVPFLGEWGSQIVSINGADMPVEPDDSGALRPTGQCAIYKQSVELIGDDPEKPVAIRFSDFGNLDELVAVKPHEGLSAGAIAGCYRSDSTGTDATIVQTDEGPQLHTVGRFGSSLYDLECLGENIWRARPPRKAFTAPVSGRGVLSFDADGRAFRYSTVQNWALPFKRCS